MLIGPRWILILLSLSLALPVTSWASPSQDTSQWVAQSDDDDEEDDEEGGNKRARDKVNLGRNQLLRNKALKKAFPAASRSVLGGPKVNVDKAKAVAGEAAKASRANASSRAKKSEPSKPGKPTKVGKTAEIDYKERARKGKISFEFSKAELIDVVKSISELTQKNFIIPEKLKSQKITILSPTKITVAEAYQVFLAALAINGVTIVKTGKFYKLIESKNSIKTTIPTCVGPEDICPQFNEQMVTILIALKHTEASQINTVLKSLVSKEGELTIFQPTNSIILSEYAPNIRRIKRIIKSLDQPGFDDELRIVQIEYAMAQEVADKITQVFDVSQKQGGKTSRKSPKKGKSSASSDERDVQISKIIADERTNQLIVKANKRSFEAIKRLISKLDVPISEAEQGRIHVYYLENAKAEDLASTLSSLTQGAANKNKSRGGKASKAKSGSNSAQLFEGEIKITADKSTNSLIVVASAHDYRALKLLVDKLNTPRRQVYIEAAILEVNINGDNEVGINWHSPVGFGSNDLGGYGDGAAGFLQSGSWAGDGGLSPTLSPAGLIGVAGGSVAGIVGKSFQIPGTEVSIPSFGMVLKWLQTDSNAQVLSTPHILTTDNEEASIEVGQKVPFRRGGGGSNLGGLASSLGSAAGGLSSAALGGLGGMGALGGMFNQVDRIDVSLKLAITPQINERNRIRLEVEQQIEDVTGVDELTKTPMTANRAIKSVVVVEDQQTIVLGGLMRENVKESESKFPILGDIPILGWFFRSQSKKQEKVNLLLVLTPYIIRDVGDFQTILERKMKEHEEFAADYYGAAEEYRAHVDYSRTLGPLAQLGRRVQEETQKLENGGQGSDDELLVQPDDAGEAPSETEFIPLSPAKEESPETEPATGEPAGAGE